MANALTCDGAPPRCDACACQCCPADPETAGPPIPDVYILYRSEVKAFHYTTLCIAQPSCLEVSVVGTQLADIHACVWPYDSMLPRALERYLRISRSIAA